MKLEGEVDIMALIKKGEEDMGLSGKKRE